MRAIVFEQHDPSPQVYRLDDALPMPEPAPDGGVVRVAYAALNRLDNFVRIGWKSLNTPAHAATWAPAMQTKPRAP